MAKLGTKTRKMNVKREAAMASTPTTEQPATESEPKPVAKKKAKKKASKKTSKKGG